MSSILKALRKLEEEKARRQQGSPDIARDILCGNFQRRRSPGWIVSCGAFLAVMVLGVLVYGFVTFGMNGKASHPAVSEVRPEPAAADVERRPAADARPHEPEPPRVAPGPEAARNLPKSPPEALPVRSPKMAADPSPVPAVASPSEVRRPDIRLSGIAYQSDPEERMAILNELPVMTGTLIDGARVEEILRDRVRLSFEGERFEVRLGHGGSGD